jgi:hypothetical protein
VGRDVFLIHGETGGMQSGSGSGSDALHD